MTSTDDRSAAPVKAAGSVVALFLAAMALGSCGGSVVCTLPALPALSVTVLNASGGRVCDATVTATDGKYTTKLAQPPPGAKVPCKYFGPYDRPGNYSVHVRLGFFGKTVSNIVVTRAAAYCPVATQHVTVRFS